MGTFTKAKRQHRTVREAAKDNAELAADVWNAILGLGHAPLVRSFAEAVHDTVPVEHAALLTVDDVAVAFAFDRLWDKAKTAPPTATPYELRTLAREAWTEFAVQAAKTEILASGFGWDVSTAWTRTRDVTLSESDMTEFERIARLAGRMHVALRGKRASKVLRMPSEVHSIEEGNDVGRLLPSEAVLLTEPLLETVALERIASRRAAQYAVRGDAKVAKGPLVVALDESGSMEGERNDWAKACAVALSRVALADRRPVMVVHYSTSTVVRRLKADDPEGLLHMVRHFLGKGTAIALALQVAVHEIREQIRKGIKGADLVLVTDGIDGHTEAQAEALKEAHGLGVRLWTVAIECEIPDSSPLRARAVHYTRLARADLTDSMSVTRFDGAL